MTTNNGSWEISTSDDWKNTMPNPTITRADQWRIAIALTCVGVVCALAEVLVFHTPPVHATTVIGGIALFTCWLILTEE